MRLLYASFCEADLSPDWIVIWQPHWAASLENLPLKHVDVYAEYPVFLRGIADWIEKRGKNPQCEQTELAAEVVCEADVFSGVGAYTVIELFYLAGKHQMYRFRQGSILYTGLSP